MHIPGQSCWEGRFGLKVRKSEVLGYLRVYAHSGMVPVSVFIVLYSVSEDILVGRCIPLSARPAGQLTVA